MGEQLAPEDSERSLPSEQRMKSTTIQQVTVELEMIVKAVLHNGYCLENDDVRCYTSPSPHLSLAMVASYPKSSTGLVLGL